MPGREPIRKTALTIARGAMTKREKITSEAKKIIAAAGPEGIRFCDLVRRLEKLLPGERHGTITGSVWNLDARFPDEICKPPKGPFRLTRFKGRRSLAVSETPRETGMCLKENLVMPPATNMKDQLERYVKRVAERHESCRDSEAATGASLIIPLFTVLGYDVADPRECKPQYKADFGRSRSKQPVDWAFFVNGSLAFLVEAKAVGKAIDRYDGQLRDYYGKEQPGVKLGVLTNGVKWRFFTDLAAEHVMDKEPFLEWDVLNDPIPYGFLTILQRAEFKPELISTWAKRRYRQSLLVAELTRLLEPSPEFVRLAIQNLEVRTLFPAVIQEWKPILGSAIQEWAQQRRLTEALGRGAIDAQDGRRQRPDETKPTKRSTRDATYREFWSPIRNEPNGLFAGKPAGGSWISKGFRGLDLSLVVQSHGCHVDVQFYHENRTQRRAEALKLFPAAQYPHELHDTPRVSYVRFRCLDKGIKDRQEWPEIREKLTKLGEHIYKAVNESDV